MLKYEFKKILVYAMLLLSSLALLVYNVHQEYVNLLNRQQDEDRIVFYEVSNDLESHINEAMIFIYGLCGFVHAQLEGDLTSKAFNTFAEESQYHSNYIKNFSVAPGNIQMHVYPLTGNEITLGHNLAKDQRENVRNDVQRAINTGNIVISGPYKLRQGSLGMVVRNPVFDGNEYWGLVNVVVDVESIIDDSMDSHKESGVEYSIASNGEVFWTSDAEDIFLLEHAIRVADSEWQLRGAIEKTLNDDNKQLLLKNALLYLLVISLAALIISRVIANNFLLSYRVKGLIYNDSLTALPNRRALDQRIDEYIREGVAFGIAFLDLDNFKDINDMLGHSVGDEVLIEITRRIQQSGQYEVFRWGGDEFIFLKKKGTRQQLRRLMETVASKVFLPIHLNGEAYNITCSIGVSFYPEDGMSKDEIIKLADATMYIAKNTGKNKVMLYTQAIGEQLQHEYRVERKLERAIRDGQLEVHYQPQYNLKKESIESLEALVRWKDEKDGFIPPSIFIPIAEHHNLINRLDEYVLEVVAKQLVEWHEIGINLRVAVNISAKHFTTALIDYMEDLLKRYNLDPSSIELEITETAAVSNFDYTKKLIEKLNDMGIHIALDDFGTGFSALNYLSELKISKLKIDRAFISKLDERGKEYTIVKSIIDITRSFEIETIAEGVENKEQLEYSKELGCDAYQGYFLSKAVPAKELLRLLNED